jgi:uncharacterized protein
MKPSIALNTHRAAIRDLASRFRTANSRVFGSVLRGHDRDGSDLDLLVDALPGATLFDPGGLAQKVSRSSGARGAARMTDEPAAEAFAGKTVEEKRAQDLAYERWFRSKVLAGIVDGAKANLILVRSGQPNDRQFANPLEATIVGHQSIGPRTKRGRYLQCIRQPQLVTRA